MDRLVIFLSSLLFLCALQGLRAVEYEVTNNEPNSPGGIIFNNQIGVQYIRQTLESASTFIWQTFKQTTEAERRPVQRVGVYIEDISSVVPPNVVAYALNGNIHVGTKYIEQYSGSRDVKEEITGVLYHEMTHIWQWDGNSQAPRNLTEGIADYVRLKANLAASDWGKPGEGTKWDEGYSVTAYFLDYCNSLRDGFVADLNAKMKDSYSDNFFVELLQKSPQQLFSDYKAKYGN